MPKKILILFGSPIKNGNTAKLVEWFCRGVNSRKAEVEVINTGLLKYKVNGCISCRKCQKLKAYACVIKDGAEPVWSKMAEADVIVMATPLYFYGPSAQLKLIIDRMFSLYKWDNQANTMTTVLAGKTLVLLASAFEDIGLDILKRSFAIIADYSGMKFESLLIKNAGESGEIIKVKGARQKAIALGKKVA